MFAGTHMVLQFELRWIKKVIKETERNNNKKTHLKQTLIAGSTCKALRGWRPSPPEAAICNNNDNNNNNSNNDNTNTNTNSITTTTNNNHTAPEAASCYY